jgi:hypothetical protein
MEEQAPDLEKRNNEVEEDGEDLEGEGDYGVINPYSLYAGKSYSDWTCDWFNWFLSADADSRNSGPVVFLRSRGLPNSISGSNISDVPPGGETYLGSGAATEHPRFTPSYSPSHRNAYINDPNVRIGGDRLRIFEDQAVFVPLIVAYWLRAETNTDWGTMKDFTGLTIDYGDNPPDNDQLTINGAAVDLNRRPLLRDEDRRPEGLHEGRLLMRDFRVGTPIFNAIVPDIQYGRSVKDFLEESPIEAGSYPAMVEGYFVLLRFPEGNYWVHSWASAPRETQGPYFSELLYQIEVSGRPEPRGRVTPWRPSRNERILNAIIEQKKRTGDLTASELKRFQKYVQSKKGRVKL